MTFNDTSTTPDPDRSAEDTDDDDDDNEGDFEDIYETAEIAIPFALAIVVIVVLCTTIAVAKMRKRRLRRQHNGQSTFPAISGGVPMNAAAYLNHEFQSETSPGYHGPNVQPNSVLYPPNPPPLYTTPGTPIEHTSMTQFNPIPYSPMMQPPKYEDIFKQSGSGNVDVIEGNREHANENHSETNMAQQTSNIGDKDNGDTTGTDLSAVGSHNKAYSEDTEVPVNQEHHSSHCDNNQEQLHNSDTEVHSQEVRPISSSDSTNIQTSCL